VPADRIGRAVSVVVTGFAASTALGVPVGVGFASQFGWHASFVAVSALVALVIGGVAASIPVAAIRPADSARTSEQIRHALAPKVFGILAVAVILFAGEYAAFTYVSPFLQQITRISASTVGWYLLGFGLASAAGSIVGGRLADIDACATLVLANLAIPMVLAALFAFGASAAASLVTMIAWGLIAVLFVPAIQTLVAQAAGPGRDIAAVLPAAGINIGIAVGSLVGGLGITAWGISAPIAIGIALSAIVIPATFMIWRGRLPSISDFAR
jgi:MFS transporter, DHA1 family, inner membrane transport protein